LDPKVLAGRKATEFIKDGMIVGLGTGSTAYHTIIRVGELITEGLKIRAVCTSLKTCELACSLNIPCLPLDEVKCIDLTIDGADEIDPAGNGIKGGRGALLYEKIVASNSKQNIWVISDHKLVETLGAFPLPVEVIPLGYTMLLRRFEELGFNPVLRKTDNEVFITDSRNYIIDLYLESIVDPYETGRLLKTFPGVVEHGLFLDTVNTAIAASETTARVIRFR
jgi:ribose 5-phosphate isomerase A